MRLIDADELLRLSHRFHISEFDRDGVEIIYADTVRNAPTVEVQKTGHWQKYEGRFDYDWECSECECSSYEKTDYCAHCGCRMESEEE